MNVTATAENNTVDPKEEARLARKQALREKREAQAAEKLRLQQLKQEESAKVEKQREEYRAKQVCSILCSFVPRKRSRLSVS